MGVEPLAHLEGFHSAESLRGTRREIMKKKQTPVTIGDKPYDPDEVLTDALLRGAKKG